jgi:hypothetical protein
MNELAREIFVVSYFILFFFIKLTLGRGTSCMWIIYRKIL